MKNKLLTTLLASAMLAIGPSCSTTTPPQVVRPESSEPLAQREHWQYDLADIVKSTVCIKSTATYDNGKSMSKFGSGFVYGSNHNFFWGDDDYYIATNAHVVNFPDETKYATSIFDPGTIVKKVSEEFYIVDNARDENSADDIKLELLVKTGEEPDTAVLTTKVLATNVPTTKKPLHVSKKYKLAPDFKLMRGDEVILVGYPLASDNYTTFGKVSATDEEGNFALDLTVNPGNSGGVVFYKDGKGELYLVGQIGMCLYRSPVCVGIGLGRPVKDLKDIWGLKDNK
ncbi:MAG: serine protease [archaeon]|nr:serine protease [archaeon]